ncbi:MAG: LysE family transporter [Saprospiraceae bacterium]
MIENLIIISLIGLVAGFILSIPAGGPTSIVIFTSALKGKINYCHQVNLGAALADLVYAFISMYGFAKFWPTFNLYVPYISIGGAFFILFISIKILNSVFRIPEENSIDPNKQLNVKYQNGYLTGVLLGFLNPGLLMSWMGSSLLVLTLLTSYGFNASGLDQKLRTEVNLAESNQYGEKDTTFTNQASKSNENLKAIENESTVSIDRNQLLLSIFYAFSVSIGSITWFYYASKLIVKYREKFNDKIVFRIIQSLGIALFLVGLVIGYKGIIML